MAQPEGLLYSKEHEWLAVDGDIATIGITDYAQSSLGDIVYVELPRIGQEIKAGATIGVVESVKSVSDLYTPVGGEVVEINSAVEADPALVNRDAFGEGWLYKLKVRDAAERETMLAPAAYEVFVTEGGH